MGIQSAKSRQENSTEQHISFLQNINSKSSFVFVLILLPIFRDTYINGGDKMTLEFASE